MTSKEALDFLTGMYEYEYSYLEKHIEETEIYKAIKQIEKDLEVLEILKSKLTICPSADNKSTYLIAKFNEEYNRDTVYPFVKSGEYEALEKIKEWLEQ